MVDLLMLAIVAGFFVVCVAYVALCDRIVGDDDVESVAAPATTDDALEVAA